MGNMQYFKHQLKLIVLTAKCNIKKIKLTQRTR
jgi:hypothetical protein